MSTNGVAHSTQELHSVVRATVKSGHASRVVPISLVCVYFIVCSTQPTFVLVLVVLRYSTPATLSVIFQSCKFQSCKFSYPVAILSSCQQIIILSANCFASKTSTKCVSCGLPMSADRNRFIAVRVHDCYCMCTYCTRLVGLSYKTDLRTVLRIRTLNDCHCQHTLNVLIF